MNDFSKGRATASVTLIVGILTLSSGLVASEPSEASGAAREIKVSQSSCVKAVTTGADELLQAVNGPRFGSDVVKLDHHYGLDNPMFVAIKDILTDDIGTLTQNGFATVKMEVPAQAAESCQVITGVQGQTTTTSPPTQHPVGVANFTLGEAFSSGVVCQDFEGWQNVAGHIPDPSAVEDKPTTASISVFPGYSGGSGWGTDPGLEVEFNTQDSLATPASVGANIYGIDIYQNRRQEGGLQDGELILEIVNSGVTGWSAKAVTLNKTESIPPSEIDVQHKFLSVVFPFSDLDGLHQPFLWTANESILAVNVATESKESGGTVEDVCPQKPGRVESAYPQNDYLALPAPKSTPTGRGHFSNDSGIPLTFISSVERAMGQGWPPFSDFELSIRYDPSDKTYAFVVVGDAPHFDGPVQPGSGVLHENSKGKWTMVDGLGEAYPCENLPNSVIAALNLTSTICTSNGTGPTVATTTTSTSPPTPSGELGSPPGAGGPWQEAPPALVSAVEDSAANDANGAFSYVSGTTFWESQDTASTDWYYVEALPPASALSSPGGAGVAEDIAGAWTIVSALSDQAAGCFGPEYQSLPPGTPGVPASIASDFGISC